MAKPKNLIELADQLAQDFDDIRTRKISVEEAKARTNNSGKQIKAYKEQREYDRYHGVKKRVPFMDH